MSIDQVEALFNKAVEMTQKASNNLPETMQSPNLFGLVFSALLQAGDTNDSSTAGRAE